MPYADILFPVNLGPLTYACPEALTAQLKPGMIVSAHLKNRIAKGVVLEWNDSPPAGRIKELSGIERNSVVFGPGMIKLIRWMSGYYVAPEGVVLKQTVPAEIFDRKKPKASKDRSAPSVPLFPLPPEDTAGIKKALLDGGYRTFLVHAPSQAYEFSLAASLITEKTGPVLVILPEVARAAEFFSSVRDMAGDRACLLHSGIPKGKRSEYIDGIVSGRHDIIIGTRPALFAPVKRASLILLLQEHSGSHKIEEGLRYHLRDTAVMRGYFDEATVVLSSVTPSIDSIFNARTGKYSLIKPAPGQRPRIRTVDMRFSWKAGSCISKSVSDAARKRLAEGKKVLFFINRRGYSTLLLCRECGQAVTCGKCGIPLVMHTDRTLRCHYCGTVAAVPERCGRCRGTGLERLGSGTQRIQEEIRELLGVEALRFDSDQVRGSSDLARVLETAADGSTRVLVGMKMMIKRISSGDRFSLAVVLNADAFLNFPDFRAAEKAYAELSSVADLIEAGGEMVIQTRSPRTPLFTCLKQGDYDAFVEDELRKRKELLFPPFARLVKISLSGAEAPSGRLAGVVRGLNRDIEILGPAPGRNRKGEEETSVLLKSSDRRALNEAAKAVSEAFRSVKGARLTVDVDPY